MVCCSGVQRKEIRNKSKRFCQKCGKEFYDDQFAYFCKDCREFRPGVLAVFQPTFGTKHCVGESMTKGHGYPTEVRVPKPFTFYEAWLFSAVATVGEHDLIEVNC